MCLLVLPFYVFAASMQCILGTTTCIATNGTKIPSKQVVDMLDSCEEFTRNDIGRLALRLSRSEIVNLSNGNVTPLAKADYSYGLLYDGPLKFDRGNKSNDAKYWEIKQSCYQLSRDFNDVLKWSK